MRYRLSDKELLEIKLKEFITHNERTVFYTG